ncbi:hypothetical protein [Virgibacillus sp. YIM 98842]|uniref:hypothetical protein n=1 Tax=Virgibacillus sp. YIM 98842 TaxID=2663533 RepID=UPI0013DA6E0F|nr:hypothetical protein [Virgibacillus sp. YIM 98842]
MNKIKTLTEKTAMYAIPIYQDKNPVGILTIDDDKKVPVIGIGNERTMVNDTGEILTMPTNACSISWTQCMGNCLPGFDTWQGCLIFFCSCLTACCSCTNPLSCIGCAACLFVGVYCLWTCRMCVPHAARPEECPV